MAVKGLAGTAVKHAEWHGSPIAERGPDCPRCVGGVHAADSSGLVRQPKVHHPASSGSGRTTRLEPPLVVAMRYLSVEEGEPRSIRLSRGIASRMSRADGLRRAARCGHCGSPLPASRHQFGQLEAAIGQVRRSERSYGHRRCFSV